MNTRFSRMLIRLSLLALLLGLVIGGGVAVATTAPPPGLLDQVVALTNKARADNGLPPLTASAQLAAAAQKHAEAMASGGFFDHQDPKTKTQVGDRTRTEGYQWSAVAENIAAGPPTAEDVVTGWLNSPGHRANILNADVREIGIGYAFKANDTFPGPNGYGHYWVQVFAAPAAGAAKAAVPAAAAGTATPPAPAASVRAWQALCPSSVDGRGHPTWKGNSVILKGGVRGPVGGKYAYSWDPGDRTPTITGAVTDPYNIAAQHVYPDAKPKTIFTARLTITDTVTLQTTNCAYPVTIYDPSQAVKSQAAIDDSLWYLHTAMQRSSKDGADYGLWPGGSYNVGVTGKSLLAFEIQGHRADGDFDRDPYVETVRRGLNYLFAQMQKQPLTVQPAGDPDSNGNGFGLYLYSDRGEAMYEDSIAATAVLVSVRDPARPVQVGGEGVKGRTYAEVGQDLVDFIVWTQVDSPNEFHRGGWRYVPQSMDADMSVTQWPVLALDAAETNWKLIVPSWTKTELRDHFLKNIQDGSGGFGYATRGSNNVARTAAGLVCLAWTGVPADDPRVTAAQKYIGDNWGQDNIGNFYTMYGVMKASRLTDPPMTLYGTHDWYNEYEAHLVQTQTAAGYWDGGGWGDRTLATAWGVLVLSRGVFSYVAPQPGSVDINCPPATLVLRPDKTAFVGSELKGVELPNCQGIPAKPADVMLVLDNSATAGSGPGSAWEQTAAVAGQLIDVFGQPIRRQREVTETSRFGMVTTAVTSTAAGLSQPLVADAAQAKTVLAALKTGGKADLAGGVRLAGQLLAKEPADRGRAVILMLHSSQAINANLIAAVQAISPTVPVYLVTSAVGVKPAEQFGDDQVKQLVPLARAFRDPTPDDLRQLFLAVTGSDVQSSGRWLRIEDAWNPAGQLEISEVKGAEGRLAGNGVVWEPPALAISDVVPISYKVKAPVLSDGSAYTLTRSIAYVDCNGFAAQRQVCNKAFLASAPPIPTPVVTVGPLTVTLTLCPGTPSAPQALAVSLPPSPVKGDVLFVFDVTSSMKEVLDSAARNADQIMSDLAKLIPDIQFGVVAVADYPMPPYGAAGDIPYTLTLRMTDDQNEVRAALGGLRLMNGGDGPEAYGKAFERVTNDPAIGWRQGARHLVVSFGDSVPHDDNLNSGMASPKPILPNQDWRTAYAQNDVAKTDSLDWQTVIAGLRNSPHQISVLHVVSGSTDRTNVPPDKLLAYWKYWAGLTGGDAVLQENASQLPDTIRGLVAQAGRQINRLYLQPSGGHAGWIQSTPLEYPNLIVPDTGLTKSFQLIVTIPIPKDPNLKIKAGTYTFTVDVVGDGTVYSTWTVQYTVPPGCGYVPPLPPCETMPWQLLPWLLPLFFLLLALLLWWLAQRMTFGDEWLKRKNENGWRCWLPCLLALLLLLLLLFLLGRCLSQTICYSLEESQLAQATVPANFRIVTPTVAPTQVPPTIRPNPTATAGGQGGGLVAAATVTQTLPLVPTPGNGSRRVALVGPMPDLGLPGMTVKPLAVDDISLDTLRDFDTLVLAQQCDSGQWPPMIQEDIRTFVAAGGKLIIYDSDECAQSLGYKWLPYPFDSNNPGARGSMNGRFTIVADDTMVSRDSKSPYFIDEKELSRSEIGDANVMLTQRRAWCGDAKARNLNLAEGFVHTYAFWGKGLIIYNGLDTDSIGMPAMSQLWQNELNQPWEGVTGVKPAGLTCQARVAGFCSIPLFGFVIPFWVPWLLLPLLWLLCYLGCRPKVAVTPSLPPPPASPRKIAYVAPPPAFGAWEGPPPVWNPEKTLIIGLGGAGRGVLTLIKKNLLDAGAGRPDPEHKVRLLLIDNAAEERIGDQAADVSFAGVRLSQDEILALGQDFNELIRDLAVDAGRQPETATWFPAGYYAERREVELDLRRGTGSQRPLGRLVVFDDLRQADTSRLWAALLNGVGAAQEGQQARVIVVGSLAGGFGSAALTDVAYLARFAARKVGAKLATVEAYLAAQHTYDDVINLSNQRTLAVNSFATFRELRRLQLVGYSFPYRITYNRRRRGDPVWDQSLDRPLLDDLYLFDGFRPNRPLTRVKPVNGVFATMADAITLHLDQFSRSGTDSLWAYRRSVQGQSSDEGRRAGQAVLSTLGTFAYRLPVYDIVEALKARWAKQFVSLFVLGEAGGALRLDPNLDRENPKGSAGGRATAFVQGAGEFGTPSQAALILGQLLGEAMSPADWATQAGALHVVDLDGEARRYQVHLADALSSLLNGADEDPLVARAGKLGYAVTWLQAIERVWSDVAGRVQMLPGRLGKRVPAEMQTWTQLPERYRAATEAVRSHFVATCAALARELDVTTQDAGWREAGKAPDAVYQRLLARETELAGHRQEMAAVVTRRYFMGDALIDDWYQRYLEGQVSPHIGRFHWQPTATGDGVDLALNGVGGQVRLRANGPEALAQALRELAGYLAQAVWNQETLATYLANADLKPDRAPATAEEMWALSAPLLDYDKGPAAETQGLTVLGVNRTVRDTTALERVFVPKLPSAKQMRRLEISDPYTMLLARMADVIPADATTPHRDAEKYYLPTYGLTRETRGQGAGAAPSAVFAAERHALAYEQRLYLLNQASRLFHPLVVAALEDEERAILFVQALAAGLVAPDEAAGGESWQVQTTRGPLRLTEPDDHRRSQLPGVLIAMLRFVSETDDVLAGVKAALDAVPDLQERWRIYEKNDLRPQLDKLGATPAGDLAAFADLVLSDLLAQ